MNDDLRNVERKRICCAELSPSDMTSSLYPVKYPSFLSNWTPLSSGHLPPDVGQFLHKSPPKLAWFFTSMSVCVWEWGSPAVRPSDVGQQSTLLRRRQSNCQPDSGGCQASTTCINIGREVCPTWGAKSHGGWSEESLRWNPLWRG